MTRLKKTTVVEDHPTWLLKVRIDLQEEADPENIVDYIKNYIKTRGFKILRAIAGTHNKCDRKVPHIHYHAEIDIAPTIKIFKAGERYKLQTELKKDKPSWYSPTSNALSATIEKPKINELLEVEECINKFLRYPLKENLVINNGVESYSPEEIVSMSKFASDEYQETLRQRREAQLKLDEDRVKWKFVCRELDLASTHSYRSACLNLMSFGDKWVDYQRVNQDRLQNLARNYCRYAKLHTPEQMFQNPTHLMLYNIDELKLKKGIWVNKNGEPENIIVR